MQSRAKIFLFIFIYLIDAQAIPEASGMPPNPFGPPLATLAVSGSSDM